MNRDTLPNEFADLRGSLDFIRRKSNTEYSAACPKCGGAQHENGDFPDRFVLMTNSTTTGGPFAFCRKCSAKWWPGKKKGQNWRETDPDVLAKIAMERESREKEIKERVQEQLSKYTAAQLWEAYTKKLTVENYQWWEKNGIPGDWVDWWRFGYTSEKQYRIGGTQRVGAAYTMPKFDLQNGTEWASWQSVNMDYRLVDAPAEAKKYRTQYGLTPACFISRPDLPIPDEIIITEGTKKGAVAALQMFPGSNETQVLAIPGNTVWANVLELVRDCGRIWIILDPDVEEMAIRLGMAAGKASRIVPLPTKLDDAFLRHGMTWANMKQFMKWGYAVC